MKKTHSFSFRGSFFLIVLAATFFLGGCAMYPALPIPMDKISDQKAEYKLSEGESKVTFSLSRLISDIPRGEQIISFPTDSSKGTYAENSPYCNYKSPGVITYSGGRQYLGDWSSELGEIFYDVMMKNNFNIVGDPGNIFDLGNQVSSEYLVGGRILDIKGNFCHNHHWWDGRPLYVYRGEMFVEVEWSILNTLTKKVVFKQKIGGFGTTEDYSNDGIMETYIRAFEASLNAFSNTTDLYNIATRKASNNSAETTFISVAISNGSKSISFENSHAIKNVVTVRVGGGHGSGVFVGEEGYILTNAHVVGQSKKVQIISPNGLSIQGEVVSVNETRDVALVKVPISVQNRLNVLTAYPKVTEVIYAVGSPLDESLSSTVTKGIVSAIRLDSQNGVNYIQGDAPISPGNSGGALYNANGSLIGLSVAKYNAEGLGLFIPVGDALAALNIEMVDK